MKRYKITFTDADTEPQTWHCRAYDADHAEEKFWDSCVNEGGAEGVRLLNITRVTEPRRKTFYRP